METICTSIPNLEIPMDINQRTFQLISLLLQYPAEDWLQIDLLREEIEELENAEVKHKLQSFLEYLKANNLNQLSVNYVDTFDFNSNTNLDLSYAAAGEERERGQLLISLKELYEEAGFEMETNELSDYLPLFLEFLSVAPPEILREALMKYGKAIDKLHAELEKVDSPYTFVMQACLIAMDQVIN